MALVQTDIKKVLAYSTVSQLGYMFLGLGVGAYGAAIFHVMTHAFFKALLFLGSGSVIHGMNEEQDMRQMGGLKLYMPVTFVTMLIGAIAISGIPPFAGFFSKDLILARAFVHSPVLWVIGAATAVMTAFYMFRLWFMTFAGSPRDQHVFEHAHESPRVMTAPLVALAIFAVVAGWALPGGLGVESLLEQSRPAGTAEAITTAGILGNITLPAEHESHVGAIHVTATLTAFLTALAGVLLAAVMYLKPLVSPVAVAHAARPIYTFLVHRWYVDELYNRIFVLPTLGLARFVAAIDTQLITIVMHSSLNILLLQDCVHIISIYAH